MVSMTRIISNPRWIPRVTELLQSYIFSINPESSTYRYSPTIRALLTKYTGTLQEPLHTPSYAPITSRVFANNYLNLNEVNVVGFDLDYTLVPYTVELQSLIFTMARDILVSAYSYPKDLKTCFFDPNFAIRGLSVDTRNGVLVKMNHLQRIGLRYSYLGKRQMTTSEMEEFYGASRHIPFGDMSKMRPLHDLFSMAEACLIADCIEIFEHIKQTRGEPYSASAIIDDVQAAIRDVHISGEMHNAVIQDLDRFVKYNPQLPDLLLHLKRSGKRLFLCTNSGFKYAHHAMSYVMGCSPSTKTIANTNADWKELFDVVICSAQKPDFFFSKKPFRHWNQVTDRPSTHPVGSLDPGEVYVHGSVYALQRAKPDWIGKNVLYIGDNLRADIVEARRWHGWRTAAVIDELDREIDTQSSPFFTELHFLRSTLRNLLSDVQMTMMQDMKDFLREHHVLDLPSSSSSASSISQQHDMHGSHHTNSHSQGIVSINKVNQELLQHEYHHNYMMMNEDELLRVLEKELQSINVELSSLFNPQFGSMFRTDGHPSLFAFATRRYADLYTSDVCNLLNYSANHRFYPPHALHMAHDPVY